MKELIVHLDYQILCFSTLPLVQLQFVLIIVHVKFESNVLGHENIRVQKNVKNIKPGESLKYIIYWHCIHGESLKYIIYRY